MSSSLLSTLSRPSSPLPLPGRPSPAAPAPPPTPAHAPSSESRGFVIYLGSLLLLALSLIWAFLPADVLFCIGLSWYPSREWALLVPSWTVLLVVTVYVSYSALAMYATPNLDSLNTLVDSKAHFLPDHDALLASFYATHDSPAAIPDLHDMPITLVNRVVHRKRGRRGCPP